MSDLAAPAHARARHLRSALVAVLLLGAALTLWLLVPQVIGHVAVLNEWRAHPVVLERVDLDGRAELEIAAEVAAELPPLPVPEHPTPRAGHVRALVPQPLYLGATPRAELTLAQHPSEAQRLLLVEPVSMWLPVLAKLALIGLLVLVAVRVQRAPWGRDRLWNGTQWVDTQSTAQRPGALAGAADGLREPREHFRGSRFWAAGLAVASVVVVLGTWFDGADKPLEAGLALTVVLGLDLVLLHLLVDVHTRHVRWDAAGIADGNFFQARRVPWSAVARFERVNTNQWAQEHYDRARRVNLDRVRGSFRPPSIYSWIAYAKGGEELFKVPSELEGEAAFADLKQRIGLALPAPVRAKPPEPAAPALSDREHDARIAKLNAGFRRTMAAVLLVVLAPLWIGTLWSSASALWFATLAERSAGTVVALPPGQLPSVEVAYPGRDGQTLTIRSDGSSAWNGVGLDAKVDVLHSADDPADARIDGFGELWLRPVVLWVIALAGTGIGWWFWRKMAPRKAQRDSSSRGARP